MYTSVFLVGIAPILGDSVKFLGFGKFENSEFSEKKRNFIC